MGELTIYTVPEAAKILKIDPNTLRIYIKDRKIVASLVGRDYRITQENILRYLDEHSTATATKTTIEKGTHA